MSTKTLELPQDISEHWYLFGKMTGLPEYNFPAFNAYESLWAAQGKKIINPARHGIVPDATTADYMALDLPLVCKCAGLFAIPGWETSIGANIELVVARMLGKPVRCALTGDFIPPDCDFVAMQTVRSMMVEGLKKHGKESWRTENQDNHLNKANRHICTYQLIRDGDSKPDGEMHLANAMCRLAMGLWQHTVA